jgi:trimeric autotransporter adhesin
MKGDIILVARWGLGILIVFSLAACGGGGGGESGDSQFTIVAMAGAGGVISPDSRTVTGGATTTFAVTAESGYGIDSVIGCGGSLSGNTYTTGPITAACTVSATFGPLLPEIPTLSLTPQAIKTFRFDWPASSRATAYRLLENPDGISGFTPVASLPDDSRSHELYVFLPERVNARYILQACNEFGCTDSSPVFVTGSLAEAVGYFKGANPLLNGVSEFGFSVALSGDGNTMAVGSPVDRTFGEDGKRGAVYVFARRDGVWAQEARLVSNRSDATRFGYNVALSSDGNVLAASDPWPDQGSRGYVLIFTRDPCPTCPMGGWRLGQSAGLSMDRFEPDRFSLSFSYFGTGLALSWSGSEVVVGAPGFPSAVSDPSSARAGRAWLFQRRGESWEVADTLRSLQTAQSTGFGVSVAIAQDSNYQLVVVGSRERTSRWTSMQGPCTFLIVRCGGPTAPQRIPRNLDARDWCV